MTGHATHTIARSAGTARARRTWGESADTGRDQACEPHAGPAGSRSAHALRACALPARFARVKRARIAHAARATYRMGPRRRPHTRNASSCRPGGYRTTCAR
eukprot:6180027-Pleurochrysis_carterae.AAC.1